MPVHHLAEEYLDAYLDAAGIRVDKKGPLFRSAPGRHRQRRLTDHAIERTGRGEMIRRRTKDAGIPAAMCCHSCRDIGITSYLANGGRIDHALKQARHAAATTSLDEVDVSSL